MTGNPFNEAENAWLLTLPEVRAEGRFLPVCTIVAIRTEGRKHGAGKKHQSADPDPDPDHSGSPAGRHSTRTKEIYQNQELYKLNTTEHAVSQQVQPETNVIRCQASVCPDAADTPAPQGDQN